MNPKDQLTDRIEKLQHFIAHKLRYSRIIGGEINYEIEMLKEFLEGYKLVKKGDLLTGKELHRLLWALGNSTDNSVTKEEASRILKKLKLLVKNIKEKET